MVRKISVHQDDVVACAFVDSINIRRAESHFTGSTMQHNLIAAIYALELSNDILGAIRRVVVDDNNLHIQVTFAEINIGKRLTVHWLF